MATLFSVKFSLEAALKQLNVEVTRRVNVGCSRALNRTVTSERAALSSAIAKDMGIRVGVAREGMSIDKATAANLAARVVCRGKRIPLIDLGARGKEPSRGKGRGVTYIGEGGGRVRNPHAFIATVGAHRHRGVFIRAVKSRPRKGLPAHSPGLPIKELFGASIVKVFEKMVPIGEARRNEVLMKNVQHEINFALSQG